MKGFACAFLVLIAKISFGQSTTVFLALDGIPYSMIQGLRDEGYFQNFNRPTLVIAPFPTVTATCFTGLFRPLGMQTSSGYDEQYYDWKANKIVGEILAFGKSPSGRHFKDQFDSIRRSTWQQFLMYIAPGATVKHDLMHLKKMILKDPSKKVFFVYIGGTDGAGHLLGENRMKHILVALEKYLHRMQRIYERRVGTPLEFVLFSDHGFHFDPLRGISTSKIRKALGSQGYRLHTRLEKRYDVVMTSWGNISGGSFYTQRGEEEAVAKILVTVPSMELVAWREEGEIGIVTMRDGSLEEARIEIRGNRLKYRRLHGDPLNLTTWLAGVHSEFLSVEEWTRRTSHHEYPAAVPRLYEAFFKLVENPASILVNLNSHHEIGSTATRWGSKLLGGLKGTHGAIDWESSAAFVMTTLDLPMPKKALYNSALAPLFKHVGL